MSDFSWDEMPKEIVQPKAAKRDTLTREEIPVAILGMANKALADQEFHYQPLPHKEIGDDFLKFIRAAGDFTDPKPSTILAKYVDEFPGPDGKTKKVAKGVMVRYSAGQRRGQKSSENGENATENATPSAENGSENGEGNGE